MVDFGKRHIPSLVAKDLSETTRFYVDKLGFRVTGEGDEGTPTVLSRDEVVLEFYQESSKRPAFQGGFSLDPPDLTDVAKTLLGKVKFEWSAGSLEIGVTGFAVKDPNGYVITFGEE